MAQRIFLSHNHKDKPIVEAVALKLASIFGQDDVFYDSWSIRPGDGIIEQMSKGLAAPEFVFFFVSASSLESQMVKLEWQNALYSATKGKTRLIPVRVDDSNMPAVLTQALFIDMYTIGLEAAIAQIVSVTQGNASFTPQHRGFSNLTYLDETLENGTVEITIHASHMMEPNPNFAFVLMNEKDEIGWWIKDCPGIQGGFHRGAFNLTDGGLANAVIMRPIVGHLAPAHPLIFELRKLGMNAVCLIDVLHDRGKNGWVPVPAKQRQAF